MILGTLMYTIGSFLMWLLVGQLTDDWHKAVKVGSTVALIGLVIFLIFYLLEGNDPATGFASAIMFAAIPIGFLAGRGGGPGWLTWLWITIAGAVLLTLIKGGRWLGKKYGT